MTLPLLPDAPPAECRNCGHKVPTGRLYDGLGEKCARDVGLLPPATPRVTGYDGQDGPNLLDILNQSHRKERAVIGSPGDVVCRQRTDDEHEAVRAAQQRRGLTGG
ncbi:hypothetical protein [Micromonospora sp. NPDC005174]|uniref:hypothetical protein n=1 Tax=Micromonospora sp. NPDC005174 TaxID=3157018 RepID=UPI0033B45A24